MGWAACLGMHHESVIGLRPDDATMTEIKSMLASEFVTISLIVPGIAGRRSADGRSALLFIGTMWKST